MIHACAAHLVAHQVSDTWTELSCQLGADTVSSDAAHLISGQPANIKWAIADQGRLVNRACFKLS
jgi:hypothetical protein